MFRVVSPPIIRSTHNCIYSIWHLSDRKLLSAVIVDKFQLLHDSGRQQLRFDQYQMLQIKLYVLLMMGESTIRNMQSSLQTQIHCLQLHLVGQLMNMTLLLLLLLLLLQPQERYFILQLSSATSSRYTNLPCSRFPRLSVQVLQFFHLLKNVLEIFNSVYYSQYYVYAHHI